MKSDRLKKVISVFHNVSLRVISAYILLIVVFSAVHAANFTVSNITQFQTALNTASANGQSDTINVLAGTYNVNPALTFSSSENYFILIRGSGSPVLDGGNARRILLLTTTSDNAGIFIEGLTIQNGQADYGGGLNIGTQGAVISLKNCTINNNVSGYVAGGANLFSNTGNITVMNCSFSGNSSPNTSGYPYGNAGGLFVQTDGAGTTTTMSGCTFTDNNAQRDAAGAMLYPLGINSTVIAESNNFANDTARESGGGCWIRGPAGNTTVTYRNNTLTGNSSSTGGNGGGTYIQITSGTINFYDNTHTGNNASWQGGGLWIEHSGGSLNIYRNRFTNNTSGESGGGANVFLDYGTLKTDHNVFNKNRTLGSGGGLNLSTTAGSVNIFNNTFYLNTSVEGGDVNIYFDNSSSVSNFYNNILYKSSQPALTYSGQHTVLAKYSDIHGGTGQPWFGIGCIDLYPFFTDTAGSNFHLQDSIHCGSQRYSPCIDAGNPAALDSIINCNWGLGLTRSDMGAYGGKYSISIGIRKLYTEIPAEYYLYQNYPNPFNSMSKIKYQISKTHIKNQNIKLVIYNSLGKEVEVLVDQIQQPGMYEVTFDGSNFASGIYFYQLKIEDPTWRTESFVATKKLILLK
jgi:hypothetical protein